MTHSEERRIHLFVLGATGSSRSELVDKALAEGFRVTAPCTIGGKSSRGSAFMGARISSLVDAGCPRSGWMERPAAI